MYVITSSDLLLEALPKFQFMLAVRPADQFPGSLFDRSDSNLNWNLKAPLPSCACNPAIPAALKFHSLYIPGVIAASVTVSPQMVVLPTFNS